MPCVVPGTECPLRTRVNWENHSNGWNFYYDSKFSVSVNDDDSAIQPILILEAHTE